jgi:hypothetical protein
MSLDLPARSSKTGLIRRISIAWRRGLHIAHQIGHMKRKERNGRKEKFRLAAFAALAFLVAAPAFAQNDLPRPPHVRGEAGMQRLIDEAARRSPAIRGWLDRLDELDVTVYVRNGLFGQLGLDGRVGLLSTNGGHRYLVIELACGRSELTQMTTLGHELFHAIEIAGEPSVVSAESLADFYTRIGMKTGDSRGLRTFETEAAAAAGQLARRQLLINTTRLGHGT